MAGQCFPGEENRAALTCHAALAATLTDERELMLIFCYTLLYFLRFMAGACIFSFLGVVAYRLPKGESFIKGRSYCPSCGHALNALDLVPVFSWLALRGRCRHCGAKIGVRYLAVDALGGAVSVLSCISFGGENARTLWAFAFCGVLTGGLYGVYLLAAKRAGRKTQFAFGPFLCAGLALSLFFGRAIAAWYLGLLHI